MKTNIILAVFLAAPVFWGLADAVKAEDSPIFLDSAKTVQIENVQPCGDAQCVGGKKFTVNIFGNHKDEHLITVDIANATAKLTSARRYKSLVLFIGELPYGGDVVTLFDVKKNQIIDVVYGYAVTFSENSRRFVFTQFYPRFSPVQYQKAIVKIYDLELSVEDNRVSRQVDVTNPILAGKPISPPNLSAADSLKTELGAEGVSLANALIFKPDWLAFAFTDNDGYISLALLVFNKVKPSLCVLPITPKFSKNKDIRFTVKSLKFVDGKLVMDFYEIGGITESFTIAPRVCGEYRVPS